MQAPLQSLEVNDFSGGRTDNYIAGDLNSFERADNLIVIKHTPTIGKLLSRFGSKLYNSTYPLVNASIARIGTLSNFINTTGSQILAFSVRKAFYLGGGGWAELQGPTSNSLYPSGTTAANINSYAIWNDHFFITNDAYTQPSKIYNDGSANLQLRSAGLPKLASSPTITPVANTAKSFIYRFIYRFDYTVNTVSFLDRGNYVEVLVQNADAPNTNANAITAIPVLANGATTNWDTSTIKVEIYRTTNAGTTFFLVGNVTNGTTTFTDNVSDATLQTNEPMYTNGGVVGNDIAPLAKLVHITGDIAYWANIKFGSQILSNQLLQSIPGDPDSVPGSFFVNVQDEIVGLSSVRGLPILLCKRSVYRVDGIFDFLGRGGMTAQKISDTATCISSQSVVQTIEGVFWAGDDSYYFTDGYQVIKLSENWADSYKLKAQIQTQKNRIQGKYDKFKRSIVWTTQSSTGGSADCDGCDVLHLDWGIKRDACFTTWSGTTFAPTAIEFVDQDMLRGDKNGYLLIHQDALTTDPHIDVGVTPANWYSDTIIWDYVSTAQNFGTTFIRKFAPRMVATMKNVTNVSLQIISINDDGRHIDSLKPIRFRGNVVWGDPTIVWGSPSIIWAFDGLIENRRMFPATSARFSYKQIEMTNAFVTISTSDVLGTASVNGSAKTIILDGATAWPVDPIGYSITFSTDNYSRQYTITARSSTTLTFSDVNNNAPTISGIDWEIMGHPKGEVFNLLSYNISYAFMGKTQQFFTPAETGDVGT